MDALSLARWQFAVTCTYHFFFVPLTLGLSVLVAIMQTRYVRTGDEIHKRMAQFWGKLFLINFAMGVVTGIVMEFQFGMNWSEYSRFVGDIFGAPLAIEALLAFFLESTFLGIWIFGWDRLPKKLHLASIWLVAIGSNLSALWILIANSFMQEPVGYTLRETVINGVTVQRAEMTDFLALITNPNIWVQFPHVLFAGITTAAFFVMGISGWHLLRRSHVDFFRRSFDTAIVFAVIGTLGVTIVGHNQAQHMIRSQPMKMAAAEALWESENPASFSLFTFGNEPERRDVFAIRIPGLLSLLAFNRFDGEVKGVKDLQAEYERQYGPGNYVPPVAVTYWSFRFMVAAGMLMIVLALYGLYLATTGRLEKKPLYLKLLPLAITLPYIGNTGGWFMAEIGRQPWIVFGLMRTEDAVSPSVSAASVLLSLVLFTLVYGVLMAIDIYLLRRYAKEGPAAVTEPAAAVTAY
ncbi:MAG: cytochrome ubiquinol oxidase subunit I [Armatimonadetes bacterium]|nr:cytochrome ubiquinol oxidase subunit I [Armatimonadota bacterium]